MKQHQLKGIPTNKGVAVAGLVGLLDLFFVYFDSSQENSACEGATTYTWLVLILTLIFIAVVLSTAAGQSLSSKFLYFGLKLIVIIGFLGVLLYTALAVGGICF